VQRERAPRIALLGTDCALGKRTTSQANLTAFPSPAWMGVAVAAGETWSFQAWHRDAIGGNATSNFTVGLEVLFR
jgi:uncharacterized NAD-dependent epimerase/dehydratase family protein